MFIKILSLFFLKGLDLKKVMKHINQLNLKFQELSQENRSLAMMLDTEREDKRTMKDEKKE